MSNAHQHTDEIVIEVFRLFKSFNNRKVLDGIDLKLYRGENLGVLGMSGTGKSVLIKCIVKLIEADAGQIRIFGTDISTLKEDELNKIRRKIGFLFQGGALYDSMTIRENLLFPLIRNKPDTTKSEMNDLVAQVLHSVALEDTQDKYPSELSGGMKKRAGLARTLILKPEIIFYDEPTTGLDPYTSKEISELIVKVKEEYNTSAIIVTHDMKCAKRSANRIVIMRNGVFMAEGSYEALLKNKNKNVQNFFR